MLSTVPNVLLGVLGLLVAVVLVVAVSSVSDPFELTYDNNVLKIQNVSEGAIEIKRIIINDRPDCVALPLAVQSSTLKVGDSLLLLTLCDAVRATITTASGSETYYLK
jgi:hypothetical protein